MATNAETSTLEERTERMDKDLLPAEALFGFMAWLTTRREVVTVSAAHDAAPIADLVGRFCEVNSLQEPRDNYTKRYDLPAE